MKKLIIPLLFLVPCAHADEQDAVRRAVDEGRLKPLAEIITQVQSRHPGRVMEVELERDDGRFVYELEVLSPDRRRIEIKVDGATGEILGNDARSTSPQHPLPVLLREVLREYPGHVTDAEYENGLYQIVIATQDGAQLRVSVDPVDGRIHRDDARATRLQQLQAMPEVMDAMLQRYPGTVLEAELERARDGSYRYEFNIRDARGDVRKLEVDAASGELITEVVSGNRD